MSHTTTPETQEAVIALRLEKAADTLAAAATCLRECRKARNWTAAASTLLAVRNLAEELLPLAEIAATLRLEQ